MTRIARSYISLISGEVNPYASPAPEGNIFDLTRSKKRERNEKIEAPNVVEPRDEFIGPEESEILLKDFSKNSR